MTSEDSERLFEVSPCTMSIKVSYLPKNFYTPQNKFLATPLVDKYIDMFGRVRKNYWYNRLEMNNVTKHNGPAGTRGTDFFVPAQP